ncbi:MAG: hypothetical protein AB7U73_10180 [Pirellulales bacterium]
MLSRWTKPYLMVATSVAALVGAPTESKAIFHWFKSCCKPAPVVAATPSCAPVPQMVTYVPQTAYRAQYVNVPVTAYQPVTSCSPCGGQTTYMQPVTTYRPQVQMVPYTTYRLVYSSLVAPAPATTTYYAPAVTTAVPTTAAYAAPAAPVAPAKPCGCGAGAPAVAATTYAPAAAAAPAPASSTTYYAPSGSTITRSVVVPGTTSPPLPGAPNVAVPSGAYQPSSSPSAPANGGAPSTYAPNNGTSGAANYPPATSGQGSTPGATNSGGTTTPAETPPPLQNLPNSSNTAPGAASPTNDATSAVPDQSGSNLPAYLRITPIPDGDRQPATSPESSSGPYLPDSGATIPADSARGRVTSIVRPLGTATPRVANTVGASSQRAPEGNLRQTSTGRWVDDSGWTAGR